MDTTNEGIEAVTLPGQFRLSFKPYIDYLKNKQQAAPSVGVANLYTYLIDQFTPTLNHDKPLQEHYSPQQIEAFFQLIATSLLPLNYDGEQFPFGFGLPIPLTLLYTSPAFQRMSSEFAQMRSSLHQRVDCDDIVRFFYQVILKKYYGVQVTREIIPLHRFQTQVNGLTAYYQITINSSFLEPYFDGELPPLQPAWVDFANHTTRHMSSLATALPLDAFAFEGFAFFQIEEITEAETLIHLQDVFAHLQTEDEPAIYERFANALRDLCGKPNLEIGLMPFLKVNDRYVHYPPYSSRSLFLNHPDALLKAKTSIFQQQIAKHFTGSTLPLVLPVLGDENDPILSVYNSKGIRSLIVYPILIGDKLGGVLEVGSTEPYALTESIIHKLEPAIPMVKELLLYQRNEFNASLDRVIRQQFTSLQPAVAWKFNEAAFDVLRTGRKEALQRDATPVHFPGVYPLYGAVDIRNSSTERHKAIHQDFTNQLTAIEEILYNNQLPSDLIQPQQLLTSCYQWQNQLASSLNPDDEAEIILFLSQEVNPYFHHLQVHHSALKELLERYFAQINPATGQFNEALRAYERSQEWINATLRDYIEQHETELQARHPHYFEKFRTDGLEYTLYAGQSITPWKVFEPSDLRQLRLWQLSSMIDMARLTHHLLPHLPLPLQTTQLILAHSQPVDLGFRRDERRFDVEGSYSIRYEVIKKRIDKALVKETDERLTQPDTIALVYANSRELADYLPLIDRFREEHKLEPEVSYLELQPLPGAIGLKALRLRIAYN